MTVSGYKALRAIVIAIAIALPAPALAEKTKELHVVGVYEGKIGAAEASVVVDRPGKDVTLALTSYIPIRWRLHVEPGTNLERIVLVGEARSRVLIDKKLFESFDVIRDLPYAYETQGYKFRELTRELPKRLGLPVIDSFSGSYYAPNDGFTVSKIDEFNGELKQDPLADTVLSPSDLPPVFRRIIDGTDAAPNSLYSFTERGIEVAESDGTIRIFPIDLTVPEIQSPVAATYDGKGRRLFGISLGGQGYLYEYSLDQRKWSVAAEMEGFDASGIIYDPSSDIVYAIGSRFLRDVSVLAIHLERKYVTVTKIAKEELPGFGDLYDPGNEPEPPLRILAVENGALLMTTEAKARPRAPLPLGFRTYVIDAKTGEAKLAAYGDSVPLKP
jgi:hypothetical protein